MARFAGNGCLHSLLGRKRRIGRHSATLPSPGTSAGSSAGTREPHCNQVVPPRFARRNRGKSHSCRSTATVSPLSPKHKFGEHYATSPGPGEAAGPSGRVCGRGGTRIVAARFAGAGFLGKVARPRSHTVAAQRLPRLPRARRIKPTIPLRRVDPARAPQPVGAARCACREPNYHQTRT